MQTLELRKYELMLIFSGEIPEADFEKELTDVRKLLQENTKGISYEDNWGRRDFAYRMKKQPRGYYVVFNFNAAPEQILELRSNIKLNQKVLRHMMLLLPDDYEPGRYKEEILEAEKFASEEKNKKRTLRPPTILAPQPRATVEEKPSPKPILAGKEEEEKLKTVEKKLEEILDNPDIEIK